MPRLNTARLSLSVNDGPRVDRQGALSTTGVQGAGDTLVTDAVGATQAISDGPSRTDTIRERNGHLKLRGLPESTPRPISVLRDLELKLAQAADPRVTPADMTRAIQRAHRAQQLLPLPQQNLFAFTRLVDAKFPIDARCLEQLASAAGTQAEVLAQVARVPANRSTIRVGPTELLHEPQTPSELVGTLIRALVMGGGAPVHIKVSHPMAAWMRETLRRGDVGIQEAIGGAGAFGANLAALLPNVSSRFYAAEPFSRDLLPRFGQRVEVVDNLGSIKRLDDITPDGSPVRVNFAAEYRAGPGLKLFEKDRVEIDGVVHALVPKETGRVIIGTPGAQDPTFSKLPRTALASLAKAHDLFFIAGPHQLTALPLAECEGAARTLAEQLAEVRVSNPHCLRHFQYVVPRSEATEPAMLRVLKGHFDSISLNAAELANMLDRSRAAGLTTHRAVLGTRDEMERPGALLDSAVALKELLGVSRVHVHGLFGDLLVLDRCSDPERQTLALLRARQLGSMKAANPSGEMRMPSEIWPVTPIVEGRGLAALHAFADAMTAKFGLTDSDRQLIVDRWYHQDSSSGATYVFSPTRGIHDFTGGTVSLGDTLDTAALVYGFTKATPKARTLI